MNYTVLTHIDIWVKKYKQKYVYINILYPDTNLTSVIMISAKQHLIFVHWNLDSQLR